MPFKARGSGNYASQCTFNIHITWVFRQTYDQRQRKDNILYHTYSSAAIHVIIPSRYVASLHVRYNYAVCLQFCPGSCLSLTLPATTPLTSTWPHLRCDVGLEEGEYRENCLCLAVMCTIIMVHKDTSSSYRSVNCIGL